MLPKPALGGRAVQTSGCVWGGEARVLLAEAGPSRPSVLFNAALPMDPGLGGVRAGRVFLVPDVFQR